MNKVDIYTTLTYIQNDLKNEFYSTAESRIAYLKEQLESDPDVISQKGRV